MAHYQDELEALRQLVEASSDPLYTSLREALRVSKPVCGVSDCGTCELAYYTRNVEGCTSSMVAGLIAGNTPHELIWPAWGTRANWLETVFLDSDPAAYALNYVTAAIQRRAQEAHAP